jgi:hypothetical protein
MRGGRLQVYDRSVFDMIPKMGSVVWENNNQNKNNNRVYKETANNNKDMKTVCQGNMIKSGR